MFAEIKKFWQKRPSSYIERLNVAMATLSVLSVISCLFFFGIIKDTFKNKYLSIFNSFYGKFLSVTAIILIISSSLANNITYAWLGLANFLPFFILFLCLQPIINQFQYLYKLAFYFSFSGFIIVIIGFLQLNFNINLPDWLSWLLGWNLVPLGNPQGRMSSVFYHANFLTLFLVVILNFNLSLFLINTSFSGKKNTNYWIIINIVLSVIGIILTNSRNGWLMTFLTFIAYAIYLQWYKILGILTLIITAISWASFGNLMGQNFFRQVVPSFIWLRFSDQMFPDRPLPTLRITQWRFCLDLIKNHPLTGVGLRNFELLYHQATGFYLGHPHNLFLMLGAETGLMGLLLLCIFVGTILRRGALVFYYQEYKSNKSLIIFSYLIAFANFIFFNCFDISVSDLRLNILGWFILASIAGMNPDHNVMKMKTK